MPVGAVRLALLAIALPVLSLGCTADSNGNTAREVRDGPLAIRVVHPLPDQPTPTSGSDYLMGTVGTGRASLWIDGTPAAVQPNGAFLWYGPVPAAPASGYHLTLALGSDTVRYVHPVARVAPEEAPRTTPPDPAATTGFVGIVGAATAAPNGGPRELVGSFTPEGPYQWFFLPGTRVWVTGRVGERVRARVAPGVEVWVAERDLSADAESTEHRLPTLGDARTISDSAWIDLVIPASDPPVYRAVEVEDGIDLELFGAGAAAQAPHTVASPDPWLRQLTRSSPSPGRVQYRIRLSGPLYGYSVRWSEGKLVLRLRRPPRIDPKRPLRGLVIAVDPGHPPAGAVGPTGLEEHEVTLAVGKRLERVLKARGAQVVMTRSDHQPVLLHDRTFIAESSNAHALVSIHADAVPSGANPFLHNGTTTYFFRGQSAPLAQAVHWAMDQHLGLSDRGVRRGDLAVVRPTWMPAVLCEGATMTIPEQEEALRTPAFQQQYADAIAAGLEHYFRALAERSTPHG